MVWIVRAICKDGDVFVLGVFSNKEAAERERACMRWHYLSLTVESHEVQ